MRIYFYKIYEHVCTCTYVYICLQAVIAESANLREKGASIRKIKGGLMARIFRKG